MYCFVCLLCDPVLPLVSLTYLGETLILERFNETASPESAYYIVGRYEGCGMDGRVSICCDDCGSISYCYTGKFW